ncbi:MAG: triose-phosphate isomerase [Bacillota bacterium]|nr:triose-phosphate isomerase [Bacillota bacterium]
MRKKLVAGNWKMNMLTKDAMFFLDAVIPRLADEALICAPFTLLSAMAAKACDTKLAIGAQNMYFEESGAFTGEISADMLSDVGVKVVILGHSERRMYFGETDEDIRRKTAAALAKGLIPIVCCGESENQENPADFVSGQLIQAFRGVDSGEASNIIVAYEPIWAIGTGKTATPEVAQKMIAHLRETLRGIFGECAEHIRILYGGSVKPSNIRDFLSQPDIDGVLVGGASLSPDSFVEMVANAKF